LPFHGEQNWLAPIACTSVTKDKSDIEKRIDNAAKVLDEIMATPDKAIPDKVISEAKCIAVIPSMVKIAVGFGGNHGKGLTTCRTAAGKWSGLAPITITGGSWGLQLGGQAVDLVMIVTNDEGMQHLLSSKFKIGADASAAAGPVGRDAGADTDWKMKAQLLTYSRARGLFAGIDLSGSVVAQDKDETLDYVRQVRALRRHSCRQGATHRHEPPVFERGLEIHGREEVREQTACRHTPVIGQVLLPLGKIEPGCRACSDRPVFVMRHSELPAPPLPPKP
jgi:lipid-binding SYLF domain-containing protein